MDKDFFDLNERQLASLLSIVESWFVLQKARKKLPLADYSMSIIKSEGLDGTEPDDFEDDQPNIVAAKQKIFDAYDMMKKSQENFFKVQRSSKLMPTQQAEYEVALKKYNNALNLTVLHINHLNSERQKELIKRQRMIALIKQRQKAKALKENIDKDIKNTKGKTLVDVLMEKKKELEKIAEDLNSPDEKKLQEKKREIQKARMNLTEALFGEGSNPYKKK